MVEHQDIDFTLPGPHVDDWEELALDYLSGSLGGSKLAAVQSHLSTCQACRKEMDGQRRLLDSLTSTPHLAAPPVDLGARVFAALGEAPGDLEQRAGRRVFAEAGSPAAARRHLQDRSLWNRLAGPFRRRRAALWLPAAAALLLVGVALSQVDGGLLSGDDQAVETTLEATSMAAQTESAEDQRQMAEEAPGSDGRSSDDTAAGGAQPETADESATGEGPTTDSPEEILRVERAPIADWPPSQSTAERLAAVTGLVRVAGLSDEQGEIYVARVTREELPLVRAGLLEAGFALEETSFAPDGAEGPDGDYDVLREARAAAREAPFLRAAGEREFSKTVPGEDDQAGIPSEDYLLLILLAAG